MRKVKVEVVVMRDIVDVWKDWTLPEHIVKWNFATDNWHCPSAENDFVVGGKFNYRMEDKESGFGHDYSGEYIEIIYHEKIVFKLDDQREVIVRFEEDGDWIRLIEEFEPDGSLSQEMQKSGWQAILDNFKEYAERWE